MFYNILKIKIFIYFIFYYYYFFFNKIKFYQLSWNYLLLKNILMNL